MPEVSLEQFKDRVLSLVPGGFLHDHVQSMPIGNGPHGQRRTFTSMPVLDNAYVKYEEIFPGGMRRTFRINEAAGTGTVKLIQDSRQSEILQLPGQSLTLERSNGEFIYDAQGNWQRVVYMTNLTYASPDETNLVSLYLTNNGGVIEAQLKETNDKSSLETGTITQETTKQLGDLQLDERRKTLQLDETDWVRIKRLGQDIQLTFFHLHPVTRRIQVKELFIFPQHIDAENISATLLDFDASEEVLRSSSTHIIRRSREE